MNTMLMNVIYAKSEIILNKTDIVRAIECCKQHFTHKWRFFFSSPFQFFVFFVVIFSLCRFSFFISGFCIKSILMNVLLTNENNTHTQTHSLVEQLEEKKAKNNRLNKISVINASNQFFVCLCARIKSSV